MSAPHRRYRAVATWRYRGLDQTQPGRSRETLAEAMADCERLRHQQGDNDGFAMFIERTTTVRVALPEPDPAS